MIITIIIIIIILINCKWVDTHPVAVVISHITYVRTMKVDYSRFSWGGLHGKHVQETSLALTGFQTTIPQSPTYQPVRYSPHPIPIVKFPTAFGNFHSSNSLTMVIVH
jgi:hypothetical protein